MDNNTITHYSQAQQCERFNHYNQLSNRKMSIEIGHNVSFLRENAIVPIFGKSINFPIWSDTMDL